MALAGVQVSPATRFSVTRAVLGRRPNLFHPSSNPSFLSPTVPVEGRWSNIGIRRPVSSDASTLLANRRGWETRDGEKTLNLAPFERVFTVQILRQISTLCARIATRPDAMNSRDDHRFESMRQYLLSSDFFETNSLHESIANLSTYNLIKNDILVEWLDSFHLKLNHDRILVRIWE